MSALVLEHIRLEPRNGSRDRAPLLVLLHGVGSNEQDLLGLAPALDERFLIVSARAPIELGPNSWGWYHVQFTTSGYIINEREAVQSRDLVLQFVNELKTSYNVDPARVFLMGFSQGCILSLGASLKQPRPFAGIVGMSGRLLDSLMEDIAPDAELTGLPLMVVHGARDTVIPIEHGHEIRDKLSRLPVNLTWKEYEMAHNVTSRSISDVSRWLSDRLNSATDWRTARA